MPAPGHVAAGQVSVAVKMMHHANREVRMSQATIRSTAAVVALLGGVACADSSKSGVPTAPETGTHAPVLASAAPTFVTIDVPGSNLTRILDLNEPGELVGIYRMSGVIHGFFRGKDEVFVTIDPPNSTQTFPHGINNRGDITGRFVEAVTGVTRGFVLADGAYTIFDAPGSNNTQPEFINERGDISGKYDDATGFQHGFVLRDGIFTTIDVPGAASTDVQVYTNDGLAVGDIRDGANPLIVHSFTLDKGVFTIFDVPGASLTLARAVGKNGSIVGYYVDPSGRHSFIRDRDGGFEQVDYPGADRTEMFGATRNGTLVGSYTVGGVEHGVMRLGH